MEVSARPFSELPELLSDRLYLFASGPGIGEGVAVRLPEGGWILIDGCKAVHPAEDTLYPLVALWRRFGGPCELAVLTHPHDDHADGFPDLLQECAPSRVGIAGTMNGKHHLLKQAEAWDESARARSTSTGMLGRRARGALKAIDQYVHGSPSRLVCLYDGANLDVAGPAAVRVCAPHTSGFRRFFERTTWLQRLKKYANDLSVVFEVTFGTTRIVLTGDLPRRHTNGGQLPAHLGWDVVMERHPQLANHTALKIPDHASTHATHSALMPAGANRPWIVTPFSNSSLPPLGDDEGMAFLLGRQSPVHLTAPASKRAEVLNSDAAQDLTRAEVVHHRALRPPRRGLAGAGPVDRGAARRGASGRVGGTPENRGTAASRWQLKVATRPQHQRKTATHISVNRRNH